MSQKTKILLHLQLFGSITQKEAIERFRCYRLAARILELTESGHNIEAVMQDNGSNVGRHARYYLRTQ